MGVMGIYKCSSKWGLQGCLSLQYTAYIARLAYCAPEVVHEPYEQLAHAIFRLVNFPGHGDLVLAIVSQQP